MNKMLITPTKLLITTRADQGVSEYSDISHPIFKAYARKVGADFVVLNHKTDCTHGDGKWHYRIMKHRELHEEYDRILHVDTDMLILPNCPNLFELVPYDKIGTIFEDKGSRRSARHHTMFEIQGKYGDVGWRQGYINTGIFLTSRIHKDIYQKIENSYWVGWGYDDAHIGYLINKMGYSIEELSYKYNHMTMFSEKWMNFPDRFQSHVIHYAGAGIFEEEAKSKIHQMKLDYEKVYGT